MPKRRRRSLKKPAKKDSSEEEDEVSDVESVDKKSDADEADDDSDSDLDTDLLEIMPKSKARDQKGRESEMSRRPKSDRAAKLEEQERMKAERERSKALLQEASSEMAELQNMLREQEKAKAKVENAVREEAAKTSAQNDAHARDLKHLQALAKTDEGDQDMSLWSTGGFVNLLGERRRETPLDAELRPLRSGDAAAGLADPDLWERLRAKLENDEHAAASVIASRVLVDIAQQAKDPMPSDVSQWLVAQLLNAETEDAAFAVWDSLRMMLSGDRSSRAGLGLFKMTTAFAEARAKDSTPRPKWTPSCTLLNEILEWMGMQARSDESNTSKRKRVHGWRELATGKNAEDAELAATRGSEESSVDRFSALVSLCAQQAWLDFDGAQETSELLVNLCLLRVDAHARTSEIWRPSEALESFVAAIPDSLWEECAERASGILLSALLDGAESSPRLALMKTESEEARSVEACCVGSFALLYSVAALPATSARCLNLKVRVCLAWLRSARVQACWPLFTLGLEGSSLEESLAVLKPEAQGRDEETISHAARAVAHLSLRAVLRCVQHGNKVDLDPVMYRALTVSTLCLGMLMEAFEGDTSASLLLLRQAIYADVLEIFAKLPQHDSRYAASLNAFQKLITDSILDRHRALKTSTMRTKPRQTTLSFAAKA